MMRLFDMTVLLSVYMGDVCQVIIPIVLQFLKSKRWRWGQGASLVNFQILG